MAKLNTSELLALSSTTLSDLFPKSPKFIINNEEFEVDILVKALSYDEVTNMFKGEDIEKTTVADVVKRRILLTVFNADTKKPLCSTIEEVGKLHPAIISAIHDASDEVNDFLGKNKLKLKSTNSGASSSSTESVEEPSSKPKRKSPQKN